MVFYAFPHNDGQGIPCPDFPFYFGRKAIKQMCPGNFRFLETHNYL